VAKTLWGKLRPKVEAKPSIREAVEYAAAAPDDADAEAALRLPLRKLLADDEALATEMAQLWEEAKASGETIIAASEGSIAAQKIEDSTVATSTRRVVQLGKYNINIERASHLAVGDNAQMNIPDVSEHEVHG
jgi:hypothetical protein